jgi:hypothetical protein
LSQQLLTGACYASAFCALYFIIVPLHWAAIGAAVLFFSVAFVYSKQPAIVTKVRPL